MRPIVLFPYHDPEEVCQPHLERIIPELKNLFAGAFLGVDLPTYKKQADFIDNLSKDPFFRICFSQPGSTFGDHCLVACERAVMDCAQDQVLHFCFIDRLAYALQCEYRKEFIADIQKTAAENSPLLFQRSYEAWQTHPSNYQAIERMAILSSDLLLKRALDLTWCHLALTIRQLESIVPLLKRRDLVMLGEMVLLLLDLLSTKEVDWLAWEDPFILGRDPQELKVERENSIGETRKRLAYVIPTLALLYEKNGDTDQPPVIKI